MRKIWVIATTEIGNAVRTKAFLVGVLIMPLAMFGLGMSQKLIEQRVDRAPKRVAVVEMNGSLFDVLVREAALRERLPRFELVRAAPGEGELELSERVRKSELYAFVILPVDGSSIRYFSDHPTYGDLHSWITDTVNDELRARRFRQAGIDAKLYARLDQRVPSTHLGLVSRAADGTIKPAEKVDQIRTLVVPLALTLLLLFPVLLSAPQLLNSVIEEKMSRVSEVLLGSVSPFELMMGKLLGGAGVALALALLYVGGGLALVIALGMSGLISAGMLLGYVLFLALAVFVYGSIYGAIGAACTEIKDAQSLMMPVVLVTMLPIMSMTAIIRAPGSPFAVGMSLFPPATPFLMLLRMGLHPAPPWWQVALGIVGTTAFAIGCVFAAGKIFRVGLLAQGKSASFGQMLRWILAK